MTSRNTQASEGFALVSAIWLAGIIAALAAAFVITTRINTKATANAQEITRLKQTADGMARLTAFALADRMAGPEAQTFIAAGIPYRCNLDADTSAEIAIQDQAGLVDLNAASPRLLEAVLATTVPDPSRAVAAIMDFRDADSERASNGAEIEDYRKAGKPYGPKNGPFQSIAELDQVLGLEGARAAALLPHVTVYGFHDGLDAAVTPESLASLIKDKAAMAATQSPRQFFAIDVIASSTTGGRYHRHAIVAIAREPDRPFQFVDWSRGEGQLDVTTSIEAAGCGLPQ